jgi:metal-responsive CopG/Arc/MetJ family transcriptional regulator
VDAQEGVLSALRPSVVAPGAFLAYFDRMSVHITLSDELAEQIDHVATDRTAFVSEAVRRLLRDKPTSTLEDEVARINQFADELNQEAEDVLEYQVIS